MNKVNGPPKFLLVVFLVAMSGLFVASALSLYYVRERSHEAHKDCLRIVATREDSRAMWLYLLDQYGSNDPERTKVFRATLDKKLPRLECNGDSWVPTRLSGE